MPILRLLPAALALLVLAAHFYRAGLVFLVPLCLGLVLLMAVRLAWVPRIVTAALVLAALEWLRTLLVLADARLEAGDPWLRLVAILGLVLALTLLAAWPLRSAAVRRWYGTAEG
jgi:uncharacterized membrane protein HdeD (DUF308 family)